MFLYKIEKYFSYVGFYVFAVRWVEPNGISFSLFFVVSCIYLYLLGTSVNVCILICLRHLGMG